MNSLLYGAGLIHFHGLVHPVLCKAGKRICIVYLKNVS